MSKKINLLFAYHAGANCRYFTTMLDLLEDNKDFSYKIVRPPEFKSMDVSPYNVLVYQTFPDYLNTKKFHAPSIEKLDKRFLDFNGLKILLDSFDMGGYNGYVRFGIDYPRIKHTPSHEYLEAFDVVSILVTTGWSYEKRFKTKFHKPLSDREIPAHCAFTLDVYPHNRREMLMDMLHKDFTNVTSYERIPVNEYDNFLRKVKISIIAGGFGETSGSIYPTLKAGALLFVHEHIRQIKSFPYSDLIDGEDYISFNLNNFSDKLDWVLSNINSGHLNAISESGCAKFHRGFDPRRSADDFLKYLKRSNCEKNIS